MEEKPQISEEAYHSSKDEDKSEKEQEVPRPKLKRTNSKQGQDFMLHAFNRIPSDPNVLKAALTDEIKDHIPDDNSTTSAKVDDKPSHPDIISTEEDSIISKAIENTEDLMLSSLRPKSVGVVAQKKRRKFNPKFSHRLPKHAFKGKKLFKTTHRIIRNANSIVQVIFKDLTSQQMVAFFLVIFSILSECGVPSPRYNFSIGAVLMQFNKKSQYSGKYVLSGLGISVLVDIFWLLRPAETSYGGNLHPTALAFGRLTLACCLILKLWLASSVYFTLHPEEDEMLASSSPKKKKRHGKLWTQYKYFFPRQTLPRRENLSFEVVMRVVALLWIHAICGILLLIIACVTMASYSNSFTSSSKIITNDSFGVPLHVLMFIKSLTLLSTLFMAFTNVQLTGCFRVFGCHKLFGANHQSVFDQQTRRPIVKYQQKWTERVAFFKSIDTLVGFYLMLVLHSSAHTTVVASASVTFIIVTVQLIGLVVDVWSTLLFLVIFRCATSLHQIFKSSEDDDIDVYIPQQLEHLYDDAASSSDSDSSSDDDDSSSDDDSEVDILGGESADISVQMSDKLERHVDEYGRAYLYNPEDGSTSWDPQQQQPHYEETEYTLEEPATTYYEEEDEEYQEEGGGGGRGLSDDVYLSNVEYNSLWDQLKTVGNFTCRIEYFPTVEELSYHLAENRFWVVSDTTDEQFQSVYFYAVKADNKSHFLVEFVMDHDSYELHVTFKCESTSHLKDYVKCLHLKDIIGNYTAI